MEGGRSSVSSQDYEKELKALEADLMSHRSLMLLLNKILEWDPIHVPAIVVGIVTLLFALIWYVEPSVLTLFSVLGLVVCVVDFVAPTISSHFHRMDGQNSQWTEMEEIHFERTCSRLLNCKKHAKDACNCMTKLKNEKPNVYLLVVLGVLAVVAWIGSLMDNLLLMYLIVIFLVLIPGLRKHGILQKFTSKISDLMKSKLPKAKTN